MTIERKGFVLAAALLALLLIAALVAGVLFVSAEGTRMGVASAARELARTAAESAMESAIQSWNQSGPVSADIGETRTSGLEASGLSVEIHVTRLDSSLYWIVADAQPAKSDTRIGGRVGGAFRLKRAADGSTTVDRISNRWWSELF